MIKFFTHTHTHTHTHTPQRTYLVRAHLQLNEILERGADRSDGEEDDKDGTLLAKLPKDRFARITFARELIHSKKEAYTEAMELYLKTMDIKASTLDITLVLLQLYVSLFTPGMLDSQEHAEDIVDLAIETRIKDAMETSPSLMPASFSNLPVAVVDRHGKIQKDPKPVKRANKTSFRYKKEVIVGLEET